MHNQKEINILERQRSELLRTLLGISPMIIGSYNEVYRKCGKANCWCQSSETGHPFKRVTWKENGASTTKAVSDENLAWVQEATRNHKIFRSTVAAIREIEIRIHEELQKQGTQIIEQSRKEKGW